MGAEEKPGRRELRKEARLAKNKKKFESWVHHRVICKTINAFSFFAIMKSEHIELRILILFDVAVKGF